MGNCESIDLAPNRICNVGHCVETAESLRANSASPTDVYFINLKPGTRYGGELIPQECVLKIFIDPSLDPTTLPHIVNDVSGNLKNFHGSQEMLYESRIYEHVVGPIMQFKFNPHFVKYYGRARNCNVKEIGDIFLDKPPYNLKEKNLEKKLVRNTWYMGLGLKNRPALQDDIPSSPLSEDNYNWLYNNMNYIPFSMICTQKALNGTSLHDWLGKNHIIGQPLQLETWILLIQLVSGLVTLMPFHCAHNDLHFGNIMVVNTNTNLFRKYIYQDVIDGTEYIYRLTTNLEIQHYDWDRSYMEKLGNNPVNEGGYLCEYYGSCNRYVPQSDLLKVFAILYRITDNSTKSDLLNILTGREDAKEFFLTRLINGGYDISFLQVPASAGAELPYRSMTPNELRLFRTPSRVLTYLVRRVKELFPSATQIGTLRQFNNEQPTDDGFEYFNFGYTHIINTLGRNCNDCTTNADCADNVNCIEGKCKEGYTTRGGREAIKGKLPFRHGMDK